MHILYINVNAVYFEIMQFKYIWKILLKKPKNLAKDLKIIL